MNTCPFAISTEAARFIRQVVLSIQLSKISYRYLVPVISLSMEETHFSRIPIGERTTLNKRVFISLEQVFLEEQREPDLVPA